jgi:protein-disulfide isomerase
MKFDLNTLAVPVSIIIAGIIIAGAVFYTSNSEQEAPKNTLQGRDQAEEAELVIRPVADNENILGNINANIKIVEFSDVNCSFCERFHNTMHRVIEHFSQTGDVAWVYRHFPVLGESSTVFAMATECVAELGGNEKFWAYTDILFDQRHNDPSFNSASIMNIAESVGINSQQLTECLNSGRHLEKITADAREAVAVGGEGTPHSIVINEQTGRKAVIKGAQNFETVLATIAEISK